MRRVVGGDRRALGTAIAVCVLLVACGSTDDTAVDPDEMAEGDDATDDDVVGDAEPTGDGGADVPDADGDDGMPSLTLDGFYGQELDWTPCFQGFECATALAPLDWAEPERATIELSLSRRPSAGTPDERIGSLLLNPGGPGGSGVDYLVRTALSGISLDVRDHYDLVGFDPRGVGWSTPIDCGDASVVELREALPLTIDDGTVLASALTRHREFGAACLEASGDLLAHVDTASAARDLDLLRALVGDEQLHYLGYSYGTALGATYAELFPKRVGRLVLDSGVDRSLSLTDIALDLAEEFESALRDYVEFCLADGDCPLAGEVPDGMAAVVAMIEAREAEPLSLPDGRPVTGSTALTVLHNALTLSDSGWPGLAPLLEGWDDAQIWEGWLGGIEEVSDLEAELRPLEAIMCIDHPMVELDHGSALQLADDLQARAPMLGRFLPSGGWTGTMLLSCGQWPVEPPPEPTPIDAADTTSILVVGVTGDRRTPYGWSVSLAEQLESGVLLTWEGDRHLAYGYANDCVHDAVDAYLIDGTLPDEGTVC